MAGMDIDRLVPPISHYSRKQDEKKQTIIDKLKAFFEKFFGIGEEFKAENTEEE